MIDFADNPGSFDAHLEEVGITEPVRGVYLRQMQDLLVWCEGRGILPGRLDEGDLVGVMRTYANESRYTLGAALDYWRAWGGGPEVYDSPDTGYESLDMEVGGDEYPGDELEAHTFDLVEVEAMDVAETAVSSYERYLVSVGLSAKTIDTYLRCILKAGSRLAEMGGDLDTADAYQLAAVSELTPLTHSMRGQLRAALSHYYDYLDRRDAPLRAVRVPPQPKMVNKALDTEDTAKLLKVARDRWPKGGTVLLGLYLGLRRAEIAGAEWERFDDRMEWYRVTGKGDKTATVPVHPVLREHLEFRRDHGYMFPGRKGVRAHISPATVGAWIGALSDDAGIGRITPHVLRHTALTTALDNTEDLRAVMEWARHERVDTTVGYTRTRKDQLQRVSRALDWLDTG